MADTTPVTAADRQAVVLTLAAMLQKLETSREPVDPRQYRLVSGRLTAELSATPMNALIGQVLDRYPAAAELYENLQYVHAGLCRAPLEQAVEAEQRMRALLAKVAHD